MHKPPVGQDCKQLPTQGWTELGDHDQIGFMGHDFERDMWQAPAAPTVQDVPRQHPERPWRVVRVGHARA